MPDFRPCSTCKSHSQAPLYHYTLRTITDRAEGTLGSLRYLLGGDHPSQTTHHALFLCYKLDSEYAKGGISRLNPQCLATLLRFLPPILHMNYPKSIRSYSKGSQGLFVPLRVIGIFTDTTISPSAWLRQCPDRCTIRAGRNLPDKEFHPIHHLSTWQSPVFLINSRPDLFTAADCYISDLSP